MEALVCQQGNYQRNNRQLYELTNSFYFGL